MLYGFALVVLLLAFLILRQEKRMSTNAGLVNLVPAVQALVTANQQILADVTKLLANQQPGLQPGQVIVNQADIDALTATVQQTTASDVAADATVNPPPAS